MNPLNSIISLSQMVEVQLSAMLNAQPLTKINTSDAKSEAKHK